MTRREHDGHASRRVILPSHPEERFLLVEDEEINLFFQISE
jgi:hypothetical protein